MGPLVSLVLSVKNGLPHLRQTIDAVKRQRYTNYELIVQDGGSTDGTLEYLKGAGLQNLDLRSEPDSGIGQGFNRAAARAQGDLVAMLSSDEFLEADAIERWVAWYDKHPDAVFINGAVRMIGENDEVLEIFESSHFDLLRHLNCEVVLAIAGMLNRRRIGSDFRFDETVPTCPDYDLWIRLGCRFPSSDFVVVSDVFKSARADRSSMSFRAESYDPFCRDKQFILDRFLDAQPASPLLDAIRRSAAAGIRLWAAESLHRLDPHTSPFLKWSREAAHIDPWSPRLRELGSFSTAFSIEPGTGRFIASSRPQPEQPVEVTSPVPDALDLRLIHSAKEWKGAEVTHGDPVEVVTPAASWHYAALIPWNRRPVMTPGYWYWVRIELEVLSGQVGIGMLIGGDILNERSISPSHGPGTVFVKMTRDDASGLIVRNGGLAQPSRVQIFSVTLETGRHD